MQDDAVTSLHVVDGNAGGAPATTTIGSDPEVTGPAAVNSAAAADTSAGDIAAPGGATGLVEPPNAPGDVEPPDPPAADIPAGPAEPPPASDVAPITRQRIDGCLTSAAYWAEKLPVFADRMQRDADRYAILAAVLSALTGLAAWGAIAQSGAWWARTMVALVGLAAAVVGIVPRVKNYAEAASKSRELASQYGSIKGRLLDGQAWLGHGSSDAVLRQLVADFENIKKSKDLLVPYPAEAQAGRNAEKAATDGRAPRPAPA